MNSAQILAILIASMVVIITSYTHEANATCVTGPSGATICAGMSQTINIAKSNFTTSIAHNGNPHVIITPDCATNDIRYGNYFNTCYQPSTLYVKSGTVVTWQNDDTWQHTVTYGSMWTELSQGYFFDSKAIEPGESYSYQFKYPGAYPYFDRFNWWETGLIFVKK
jgi:plastocyanin